LASQKPGMSNKVEVRTSTVAGYGWYAKEDIKKGEIIFWPYENADRFDFHINDILQWKPERRRKFLKIAVQVDDDIYNGYHSETENMTEAMKLEWCLNHSCDPNVWYLTKDVIETRRDVKKGDELFYDYATSQANDKMDMKCSCGSSNCRKILKGDDWKLKHIQDAYGDHFMPYILKKIHSFRKTIYSFSFLSFGGYSGKDVEELCFPISILFFAFAVAVAVAVVTLLSALIHVGTLVNDLLGEVERKLTGLGGDLGTVL